MAPSSDIDGGLSIFKNYLIANDNKIGTAPPAVLGPMTRLGRVKLKKFSAGLSDKWIQLRYDFSAEDDADIVKEDGSREPMFFGATRMDRAYALRRTMLEHEWSAATIIHQTTYGEDDGKFAHPYSKPLNP